MIDDGWFVVRSQTQKESWAATNILVQQPSAVVYLPVIPQVVRVKGYGEEVRSQYMFPGYLFVRTENLQWRFLLSTFGVRGLPMFGNEPGMILPKEVDKLKAREDEAGRIVLPRKEDFRPGTTVRVKQGTFNGHIGIVQGMSSRQRCKVLMEVMGRKVPVLLATMDLEKEL